jgi:hypothetical protein
MQCDWKVNSRQHGQGKENGAERLAAVRRRLLLGVYDSDDVVYEVARRLLAGGELGWEAGVRGRPTQQRSQVDYRGM